MTTPTPYETLIAAKLEKIPVPDMADSIWDSIEMQLNADLSMNNDDKPSGNNSKVKTGMGKGFYFSILAAIIIVMVIIYKENKKIKNRNKILPTIIKPEMLLPAMDSSQPIKEAVEKINKTVPGNISRKDTVATPYNPSYRIHFDTLSHQAVSFTKTDSSLPILKNNTVPTSLDSIIRFPINKAKGVKDITDDDYKIKAGKKDTNKKGD